MSVKTDLENLYITDEDQWLEETIKLLKSRRFSELDLKNLIEALEDLGNEKKRAVESLLEHIIRHLLLCQYWTEQYERNAGHWESEIVGFRTQLKRRLTTNLRNHLERELPIIYQDALLFVQRKTRLKVNFPQQCPYRLEQLLDNSWFPR
ncbi:protein of unknown function DUF29 [Rippkaea orientalis PCC 8801]|uniref:DUF29 domain-containing protein n=1 Tax=Rippkaea orientalis (strain PCC 8801 / RF-1) TaxID=41431 RepID=B7JXX4_RIPO1|nr:DUF29 domain-containing protein [Rippkaea orientalis]ACK65938.1 protein of unknown function DUF29 [Rippkaea orientalis PCC 8801]